VRGRSVDRVNKGRLDPKDLFGWQANNSEDRLKRPLVRKDGELVEASWDEAFDRPTIRSKALLDEKGPLAFGFYTTGQLFLEEFYTLGVISAARSLFRGCRGNERGRKYNPRPCEKRSVYNLSCAAVRGMPYCQLVRVTMI
jgi:predicted molibdopterin-dependent oxidoreductase YjgC